MKKKCQWPGCKASIVAPGPNYCAPHRVKGKAFAAPETRANAGQRGYGADWAARRAAHLAEPAHQFCAACGVFVGRRGHVDHLHSVASAPGRRLEAANLQTLCHGCHNRKTGAERRAGLTRDAAGGGHAPQGFEIRTAAAIRPGRSAGPTRRG